MMARGSKSRNRKVIPEAAQAMEQFKYEVASELGINPEYKSGYWGTFLLVNAVLLGTYGSQDDRRCRTVAHQSAGWIRPGARCPRKP